MRVRLWGDGKSGIETYVNVATNNGGNLGDGQFNSPNKRSQYNAKFGANESLELRNGCKDGSLDRVHNVGDLGDRAVGGNDVSCQSTSEMDHMGAVSTYSIDQCRVQFRSKRCQRWRQRKVGRHDGERQKFHLERM